MCASDCERIKSAAPRRNLKSFFSQESNQATLSRPTKSSGRINVSGSSIGKRSARDDEVKPVVFFEQVVRDLEETINFYMDNKDPDLAMRFLTTLRKTSSLLVPSPGIGTPAKGRNMGIAVRWLALALPFHKHLISVVPKPKPVRSFGCCMRAEISRRF
jgi:hypothetical protein